jgi:hypothetical protein
MDRTLETNRADIVRKLFAAMSVASGVALALAPERMADLYAFPRHRPRLVRALGVRDVAIGALLFRSETEHLGYRARAAADAVDVALMLREVVSGRRRFAPLAARVAGGIVSVAVAIHGALARRPRIRVDGA